jgi:hypothetical protein
MKFHKDGTLPQNGEVFVFGSNLAGIHGAGAAKIAHQKFGAIYGAGMGLMGRSWAIPTKDKLLNTLSLSDIERHIHIFVNDAPKFFPEHNWFVTRVGCGLAGYKDEQIAPMFRGAKNCSFAEEWRPYLEEVSYPEKLPFPIFTEYKNEITCPKCGIVWSGAMGYSCPDYKCPVQAKAYC